MESTNNQSQTLSNQTNANGQHEEQISAQDQRILQEILNQNTINIFSVDIKELLPLVADPSKKDEDVLLLGQAISQVFQSKTQLRSDNEVPKKQSTYIEAIKFAEKSVKSIDHLYQKRNSQGQSDYQILLAPFHYFLGHVLTNYIEEYTDEYGNLPQLNLAHSDDEGDDDEDDDAEENQNEESKSNAGDAANETNKQNKEESKKETLDDQPVIQEETVQQINTTTSNKEETKKDDEEKEEDFGSMMQDDAVYNLALSIQMTEDFISSEKGFAQEQNLRKDACFYLMVDAYQRRAELLQFKELFADAIEDFSKVVELCKERPQRNERTMAGALYNLAQIYITQKENDKAKDCFILASTIIRALIIKRAREADANFPQNPSPQKLIEENALFDNDAFSDIIELQQLFKEMTNQVQDAEDSKLDQAKLDEMKKKEGEEVVVSENFGKVQPDASNYKTVEFVKKRTSAQAGISTTEQNDSIKRLKTGDDQSTQPSKKETEQNENKPLNQ